MARSHKEVGCFFISRAYLTILIIKTIWFKEVFLGDSEKRNSSYISNDDLDEAENDPDLYFHDFHHYFHFIPLG